MIFKCNKGWDCDFLLVDSLVQPIDTHLIALVGRGRGWVVRVLATVSEELKWYSLVDNGYIRVIGDESEARFQTHSQFYCAKVRLKSMFLQAMVASESVFDHANRISCLKLGVLVYTVSRLSKCRGYQNVEAIKMSRLSKCRGYQNVEAIKMSRLSKCQGYQNVKAIKMSRLSKCRGYQNVEATKMSRLSKCQGYQNVKAIKMSRLSKCQGYQNVEAIKMSRLDLIPAWARNFSKTLSVHPAVK